MDAARKELDEVEIKPRPSRPRTTASLPDQLDSNVHQLQALQIQVGNVGSQISRVQQDRLQIQSNIQILKDSASAIAKEQPTEPQTREYQAKNLKLAEAERAVENVETALNLLLQRYKGDWPDVQTMRQRLAVADEQVRDDLIKEDAASKKADAATPAPQRQLDPIKTRELRDYDARIRQYQTAIEAHGYGYCLAHSRTGST